MALYHAHTSYISRGSTNSVCAHVAYICAEKVKDERTGELFDFTKKRKEVLHKEILLPAEAEGLFLTTEDIWNAVEQHEDYIAESRYGNYRDPVKQQKSLAAKERFLETAVLGFKLECSLPVEFNEAQKIALSKKIAKELFLSKNLIVEYAIHDIKDNPHVHFLSNFRPIVEGKFSNRKVHFRPKDIKEMRKQIADITNEYAKEQGFDFRIDHRSYKEQGIEKVPTQHRGWYGSILNERSRIYHDNKEILSENTKKLLLAPEELLKSIIPNKTVFTLNDLQKGILKQFKKDAQAHYVLDTYLKGRGVERLLERANTFGAFMGVCQDIRDLAKVPHQTKSIQQDIESLTYRRTDLAKEIHADYGQYKWLMSRCGHISKERLLILSERGNITWNNKADPFDKGNIPKDLDAGSVLMSLESCKKEALGKAGESPLLKQEVIDLFNLQYAGKDIRDQPYYVQRQDHQKERHVSRLIEALSQEEMTLSITQRLFQKVPEKLFKKVIETEEKQQGYTFSREQKGAIEYLSTHKRYVSLIGQAGTGKTTVLRAVAGTYKAAGYKVVGTSFQGAAVGELSRSLGDRMDHGYTLDKIYSELQKETSLFKLTPKSVVIVDEAGMAPPRLLIPLLETVKVVGAKVIMVGDPGQIPAIDRADYGRLLLEGGAILKEIRRQEKEEHLNASQYFAKGDYIAALDIYAREAHIDVSHGEVGAKMKAAAGFMEDLAALKRSFVCKYDTVASCMPGWSNSSGNEGPGICEGLSNTAQQFQEKNTSFSNLYDSREYQHYLLQQGALAFRRKDVFDINMSIQSQMKGMGFLGERVAVYTRYHNMTQKEWERLVLDGLHDELIDHIRSSNVPWGQCIGSMANLKKPAYGHVKEILDVLKEKDSPYYAILSQRVGLKTFYMGEKVIFKRNWNCTKGITSDHSIYNGTVGILTRCQDNVLRIRVNEGGGGDVDVDLREYADIDLGYAMTINRSQGKTLDRVYVYLGNTNQAKLQENLLYVAGTRHRKEVFFYTHEQYLQGRAVYDVVDSRHQKLLSRDLNRDIGKEEGDVPEGNLLGEIKKSPIPKDLFTLKEQARALHISIQRDVRAGKCDRKDHEQYQTYREILDTRKEVAKSLLESYEIYGLQLKAVGVNIKHLKQLAGDLPYTPTMEDGIIDAYKSYRNEADLLWKTINQTKHKKQHPDYETFIEIKARRDEKAYDALSFGIFREDTSLSGKHTLKTPKYQFERSSDYRQLRQHANQHMRRMQRGDIPRHIQKDMETWQESYVLEAAEKAQLTAGILPSKGPQEKKNTAFNADSTVSPRKILVSKAGAKRKQHVHERGASRQDMQKFFEKVRSSIDVEGFITSAFGKGTPSGEYLRFGKKGHLSIHRQTGNWHNFREGTSGSLLGSRSKPGVLSQSELDQGLLYRSNSFEDTLRYATNFIYDHEVHKAVTAYLDKKRVSLYVPPEDMEKKKEQQAKRFEAMQQIQQQKKDHAIQKASQTRPMENTPVETYLKKRGIDVSTVTTTSKIGYTSKGEYNKGAALGSGGNVLPSANNTAVVEASDNVTPAKGQTGNEVANAHDQMHQSTGPHKGATLLIEQNRTVPARKPPTDAHQQNASVTSPEHPSDIRYMKGDLNHHMVGIIRDHQNNIQGIQRTYLTNEGQKDPGQSVCKRTEGILRGGFVRIQEDHNNTNKVILAEGIETALSLKQAGIEGEIRAVLSIHNFKTQEGLQGKEVIIAADNDHHKMDPALSRAVLDAKQELDATIIQPPKAGQDFNDVLQEKGTKGIQEIFDRGTTVDTFKENFMNELQKKCDYLDKGIQECRFVEEDFGIQGPDRKLHGTSDEYLAAIGQDDTFKEVIDYKSKLGEQIQEEVRYMQEKQMDKGWSM